MSKVSTMQTHKMMAWLQFLKKDLARIKLLLTVCMKDECNDITPFFGPFQTVIYISLIHSGAMKKVVKRAKLWP